MLKKILLAAAALGVLLFLAYSVKKSTVITHGFASYYTFSRILLEGEPLSKAYDTTYFNEKIRQNGIENIHDLANNTPLSSLMFPPVSVLKPEIAKAVWTAISVLSLLLAVYILFLVFDIPNSNTTGLALFVTAFLFYPAYYNISLGQVYIFILLLFSLSLYGLRKNNPWLVSIPLGLVLAIKGYGFIPLFLLPFARKWKEAVLTSGVVIVIVLLTLPFIHIQAWTEYYTKIFTTLGRDEYSSNVAYQTVNSLLRHLFFTGQANVPAVFDPAEITVTLVSFAVLGIVAFGRKRISPVNLITAGIALNIVLAPLAEEYHYVLMLPLIFLLGCTIAPSAAVNKITVIVFLISLVILAMPLNYKSLQAAQFPLVLLAYPKLFSAIVILLIFRFTSFWDLEIAGKTTG